MTKLAYIIITEDGVDQIAETKTDCGRELKDLRKSDTPAVCSAVLWEDQDAAVEMIERLIGEGCGIGHIRAEVNKALHPDRDAGRV